MPKRTVSASEATQPAPGDLVVLSEDVWPGAFVQEFRFDAFERMSNWTIVIEMEAEIVDIWNAEIVSRNGNLYTITGASWQSRLKLGESASFGIKAEGNNTDFTLLEVNDVPVKATAVVEEETDIAVPDATQPDAGEFDATEPDSAEAETLTEVPPIEEQAVQEPEEPVSSGLFTGETITATWQVAETWNGGYNMTLKVSNNGHEPIEAWVLVLEAEGLSLSDSWGSTWTDLGNGCIALTGSDYGAILAAGSSVNIGFTGLGTPPADMTVQRETIEGPDGGVADVSAPAVPDSPFDATDYSDVLGLSMDFYYAQYSGELPDSHPITWRGDSALDDGADVGRDLTGGWYDAGDHVKFGLPMAYTATTLAWGAKDYKAGYEVAGAYDDVVAHLDWVTDYLLRCYDDKGTEDLSDDVFYAQVGDGHLDHAFWGAPEDMTMERPAFWVTAENPGTEVTAESAAAMAASSMVLRDAGDVERADELLAQAKKLFAFSEAYQGVYSDAIPEADQFYHSWTGYQDEIAWSATWLYEATGEEVYLEKAEAAYHANGVYWAMTWDDKSMGTAVRLARLTDDQRYFDDLERHMNHWENSVARTPGTETNEGLGWLDMWGSNRYAANTAFVALSYASLLDGRGEPARADEIRAFASDQIDYMLGDNPDSFSYVVGFGDNYALSPHHRGATGSVGVGSSDPNEHILYGALVGGPDAYGAYEDIRSDYIANEVAIDYNAGFSGALAALIQEDTSAFWSV